MLPVRELENRDGSVASRAGARDLVPEWREWAALWKTQAIARRAKNEAATVAAAPDLVAVAEYSFASQRSATLVRRSTGYVETRSVVWLFDRRAMLFANAVDALRKGYVLNTSIKIGVSRHMGGNAPHVVARLLKGDRLDEEIGFAPVALFAPSVRA